MNKDSHNNKGNFMQRRIFDLESSTLHLLVVSILLLVSVVFSETSFGHGMDKPGPHGGFIQMPGDFHTELLRVGESKLRIYLLDVNFKNVPLQNSKLEAKLTRGAFTSNLSCLKTSEAFECQLPPNEKFIAGDKIILNASLQKTAGGLAIYPFPFKLAK